MTTRTAAPTRSASTRPVDRLVALSHGVGRYLGDVIPGTPMSAALKCAREADELPALPSLDGAADVLICLLGWTELEGHTVQSLIAAAEAKVRANRARSWSLLGDGTWQHLPAEDAAPMPGAPALAAASLQAAS